MFDLDAFIASGLPLGTRFGLLIHQPEATRTVPYPHYVCAIHNADRGRRVVPILSYGYGRTPEEACLDAVRDWLTTEHRYLEVKRVAKPSQNADLPPLTLEDLNLE